METKAEFHHRAPVVANDPIGTDHFRLVLRNDGLAKNTRAGQFVNLRINGREELRLRRPFSVARTHPRDSLVEIIYQVVGGGTASMVDLRCGDEVDLLGPLGKGFSLPPESGDCLLIGGGCGVAPLLGLADALRGTRGRTKALIGFKSADRVFGEEELKGLGAEVLVATDDGSYGLPGFVSNHLLPLLQKSITRAYLCGPAPMLRAVLPMVRMAGIKGEVSLEERMGCGFGVCLSCVADIRRDGAVEKLRVCADGPVFDLEEIVP